MYRPGINSPFSLLLFFPFFLQSSCGTAQVLGLSRQEAAELLRKGDTEFIRQAKLPADLNPKGFSQAVSLLKQLILINPAAPFYAGLLAGGGELEKLLFFAALESPSLSVRREAALKLIPMILEAKEPKEAGDILGFLDSDKSKNKTGFLSVLRAACLYRLGRYEEMRSFRRNFQVKSPPAGSPDEAWEKVLALFADWKAPPGENAEMSRTEIQREVLTLLLEPLSEEIRRWAYEEAFSLEGLLSSTEQAALSGRLLSGNYRAALDNLRQALADGGSAFFRHPSLIADLGRAYQYTPSMREEGISLFRAWNRFLETGEHLTLPPSLNGENGPGEFLELSRYKDTLDSEALNTRKYLVLFYSGRMERANGNYTESSDYFTQAAEIAPDAAQSDACIWYVLTNAMDKYPSTMASLVQSTISRWNDVSYFADVMDRLSSYLMGKRQWAVLLEVFSCLEDRGAGASLAQYAWILGRASQEGYIETNRPGTEDSAERFFRIAFEEGNASFYYRAMAASKLGISFAPEMEKNEAEKKGLPKTQEEIDMEAEADFILGFFEYGAVSFAMPYIETLENKLPIPELRKIAGAIAASGLLKESLELVSRYTRRENYEINRQDLLLFYPQPFREFIEKYAGEAEIGAEILYGLIRTESYFVPDIVSRSGAVGLTQLMPATAAEMAVRIVRQGGPDYREMDLKDPELNIHTGSFYLRYLIEQMGSPMTALLAYNGGMGRLRRWLAADRQLGGLPQDLFLETIEYRETREYGRRVLAAAAVYGYLYYGMSMEEVAADIYR